MTPWQRWVHRPQELWVRRSLFQIHLWTGIAIGLYVVVISISGSAIIYSRDLGRRDARRAVVVADAGHTRMRLEELQQSVAQAYPTYEILSVIEPEKADQPDAIILQHRKTRIERLFDPYTGVDLGDPRSRTDRLFSWLADLHDNLLSGLTGRTLNGIGAFLIMLLALTGSFVWWPGIKNWRRSLAINRRARFARLNWDLHSAVGFWCFLFVLIWGISGICLCFPATLDFLLGIELRTWLTRLHFGRFNGVTEALWTILGLAPAVLAGTGALMWWNRVLSKKLRNWRSKRTNARPRASAQSAAGLVH
jgi:uncharacterized iron-regulated membrane protein